MRGHRDLRLLFALTLICAVGSVITPLGPVRVIFAVPLTLILPGYAIAAAAFARRPLDWPERLPLTLGLSLACLALSSLLLNYTPGGIRGLPWAILLVLVVFFCCRSAARRRGRADRKAGSRKANTLGKLPKPRPATAILAAVALALVAVALVIAQGTPHNDQAAGYTQLWIAPAKPAQLSAQVGVTSEQQQTRAYRMTIEVEGRSSPIEQSFELQPGETRVVTIQPEEVETPVRVDAKLYLRGRPDAVYRRVSTLLNASEASVR